MESLQDIMVMEYRPQNVGGPGDSEVLVRLQSEVTDFIPAIIKVSVVKAEE